jgi:hypothetical protein
MQKSTSNVKYFHRVRRDPTVPFVIPPISKMTLLKERASTSTYRYRHYVEKTGSFVLITIRGSTETIKRRAEQQEMRPWIARLTLVK